MISERLRFHGRYASESKDECAARKNTERETAADVIDALVEAAERGRYYVDAAVREDGGIENCDVGYRVDIEAIDKALAMARRK